jgi:hypothetical protein
VIVQSSRTEPFGHVRAQLGTRIFAIRTKRGHGPKSRIRRPIASATCLPVSGRQVKLQTPKSNLLEIKECQRIVLSRIVRRPNVRELGEQISMGCKSISYHLAIREQRKEVSFDVVGERPAVARVRCLARRLIRQHVR